MLLVGIQTKEIMQQKQNNTAMNKISAGLFVIAKSEIIKHQAFPQWYQ